MRQITLFSDKLNKYNLSRLADIDKAVKYITPQGSLKIYEINEETYEEGLKKQPQLLFSNLPTNDSTDVLLRVYCVAAVGLAPLDFGGSCDPYLEIKCGKTTVNNKDDYITKDLNPIFGKYVFSVKSLPCFVKYFSNHIYSFCKHIPVCEIFVNAFLTRNFPDWINEK